MNPFHGDARWTAYVLAETDVRERGRMDEELAASPDAREMVAGLRESAHLVAAALDMLPPLHLSQRERASITHASRTASDVATPVVASCRVAESQVFWRRLAFGGIAAGALGVAAGALIAAQSPAPPASNIEWAAAGAIPQPRQGPDSSVPEMRLELVTEPTNTPASFAVSPDGRAIVYVAMPTRFGPLPVSGESELMVRELDEVSPRAIARGHLTALPFWSPDGRSVGFFADGKLKRLDIAGGEPAVLANAPEPGGGAWGPGNTILFAPRTDGPIMQVPAGGGTPSPVTRLRPMQKGHLRPQFISQERFLFQDVGGEQSHGIHVATIGSLDTRRVLNADAAHLHVPSGHLVFVRNATLMAQRFDASEGAVVGAVHTLAERIVVDHAFAAAPAVSVAAAGPIVYRTQRVNPAELADGRSLAISPDGRWLAYRATAPNRPGTDLWIRRLAPPQENAEESLQRVAAEGGRQLVWRADGSELFFVDAAGNTMAVRVRADEQGLQIDKPTPLFPADNRSMRFSPDGRYIAFRYPSLVVLLNWAPPS